jgi:spectinomycin phosphotransferase/16S rRNA (guanine(1405)-N(7))-methyltransferase
MLVPPDDLPEAALVSALRRSWEVTVSSLEYRAVGWGSHHWEVADTAGSRWFVTADDLNKRRRSDGEPVNAAFGRLRASLAAARDLRDCGRSFVVAPVRAGNGEPLARVGDRFAVALYPFIEGQSFGWGEFSSPGHRLGVLGLVAAMHTAPAAASRHALPDDFAVPQRDELEAACDPTHETPDRGPYARPASLLVQQNAAPIQRLVARYDDLVRQARAQSARAVLTHGEIHSANTMLTADGWVLIDWDTALVAPPERDLWNLDPGDGTILDAYATATGVVPQPSLLDLYRLRWDITDIAMDVGRFRQPHAGSAEDAKCWQLLSSLLDRVSGVR